MTENIKNLEKYFRRNPHEIRNEMYGDGISIYGKRDMNNMGVTEEEYISVILKLSTEKSVLDKNKKEEKEEEI